MGSELNVFSWGNKKLPKTTAIFNLTTAVGCPALIKGLCQLKNPLRECYAIKTEKRFKQVIPFRLRQGKFWKSCTDKQFIDKLLEERKNREIKKLRLNESGDFRGQKDIIKADRIAGKLFNDLGIITYCYTARSDLDFTKRKCLIVNGSNFMVDNKFKVVYHPKDLGKIVCGGDCRVCSMCSEQKKRVIFVLKH